MTIPWPVLATTPGPTDDPSSVSSDLTLAPSEKRELDRRLNDLARRVRYIEERLRIVQRDTPDEQTG